MPSTPDQLTALQSRPDQLPVMKQRWSGLGFYHWSIDPDTISARLPKGLHVDTFDGKAWLGIVPFFMQRVRPLLLPPVPWLSWFHELNLRTYVHDENGKPGVWFFSLDCNQPLAVEIARKFFRLPYQHATMSSQIREGTIHYKSSRKNSDLPESSFSYPIAKSPAPAIPGSLEHFLVERYLLFSPGKNDDLYVGRVNHAPYLIEPMSAATCSTEIFPLNQFSQPERPAESLLTAAPVDVTIFPLRKTS
ncbi:MAG: YqjF family protein [Luteolibacter sp.]